jgi:hypothetical protein
MAFSPVDPYDHLCVEGGHVLDVLRCDQRTQAVLLFSLSVVCMLKVKPLLD